MTEIFKRTFEIAAAFVSPVDLYVIKKDSELRSIQVSATDAKETLLLRDDILKEVPDYTRLADKHTFSGNIRIECVADLVLVDGEICKVTELPVVLSI